jgi:hypothetical protein
MNEGVDLIFGLLKVIFNILSLLYIKSCINIGSLVKISVFSIHRVKSTLAMMKLIKKI